MITVRLTSKVFSWVRWEAAEILVYTKWPPLLVKSNGDHFNHIGGLYKPRECYQIGRL
jgi:hypothetical protein